MHPMTTGSLFFLVDQFLCSIVKMGSFSRWLKSFPWFQLRLRGYEEGHIILRFKKFSWMYHQTWHQVDWTKKEFLENKTLFIVIWLMQMKQVHKDFPFSPLLNLRLACLKHQLKNKIVVERQRLSLSVYSKWWVNAAHLCHVNVVNIVSHLDVTG